MRLPPQGSILIFHQKFLIPWNICRKYLLPLRQHSEPDRREQRQQQRQYVVVKVAVCSSPATQDEENEIFNYLSVEGRAEVLKNFKGLGIQQLSP